MEYMIIPDQKTYLPVLYKDLPNAKEGTTYIYGLIDPETDKLRYVGKALDVKLRHTGHHCKARLGNNHKSNWIRGLLSKGLRAKVCILDAVDTKYWREAEIAWIAKLKSEGYDLTNGTLGGDGTQGVVLTEAQRQARRAFRHTPEAIAAIAKAQIGRVYLTGRKATEEEKQKKSVSLKAFWENKEQRQMPQSCRDAGIKARSKDWQITAPDGTVEKISNLNAYCRRNSLTYCCMSMIGTGVKGKFHKGYTCKQL